MTDEITITQVTEADAQELLDIYAYYVLNTAITFEYEVPTLEEFRRRIRNTLQRYPYIAVKQRDEILGYAYTGHMNIREAYDWSVETSIYLKNGVTLHGLGRRLYETLEEISEMQHITNMNACIGVPIEEDEYLTNNSMDFHKHMGYRMVGRFHKCGFKFGTWYDMVWMEKIIGDHLVAPEPVVPFQSLDFFKL